MICYHVVYKETFRHVLLTLYCCKNGDSLVGVEKSNLSLCGVLRRDVGSDYTMDETAVYNNEFDSDTRLVMQGAKVTGDYKTRRHLNMAIKMVYQVQLDEGNWSRWPDLIEHYHSVQANSFFHVVQCMGENLVIQPPVSFTIYKTFTMIEFRKFKNFYSELDWNIIG